jgi:hypothetical protein
MPQVAATVNNQLTQIFSHSTPQPVMAISNWIRYNDVTPTIGTINGPFSIIAVSVTVTEAFNCGAPICNVGVSGATDRWATISTDMSTTGVKTMTPGAGFGYYNTLPDTITALTGGGGSTGKALIVVQYIQAPWQ